MSRTEVRQKWRAILAEYEQSDSSISEYCRRHHINPGSFYQWRKKLAADQLDRFLPVVIEFALATTRYLKCSNTAVLKHYNRSSMGWR
jgi:transposase-like protein